MKDIYFSLMVHIVYNWKSKIENDITASWLCRFLIIPGNWLIDQIGIKYIGAT